MPPPHLNVVGVDPGATTGWARLTVPRESIYGQEPYELLRFEHGELEGTENQITRGLCRLARSVQSLDYQIGPAMILEGFDIPPHVPTTDPVLLAPVRIAAKLEYAAFRGECGDAHIVVQSRGMAKSTATDERLRAWGLYVKGSDHIRDATRQAITMLRRAKASAELRAQLWNHVAGEPR